MKKLFAIIMSVLMLTCFMPSMAFAEEPTTWGTDLTAQPNGYTLNETDKTVTISSAEGLAWFAKQVNGTTEAGAAKDFENYRITLTNDISLSGKEWTPIGTGTRADKDADGKEIGYTYTTDSKPFKGIFDGNGKTISGLNIITGSGDKAIGLFGVVAGGTVKNLKLAGVNISVSDNKLAGGAVGFLVEGGTVDHVTVSGSISAKKGVGGVVGRMTKSGAISNCTNAATVSAEESNVGGIVGAAYYTDLDKVMTISHCTNSGTVTGGNVCVGGIAGLSAANISDCENTGAVTGTNESNVSINSVGGIAGGGQSYGSVENCTNKAPISISGQNTTNGAGGIVGWIVYSESKSNYPRCAAVEVRNNTNEGSVTSTGISAGGIVGHVHYKAVVTGNKNYATTVSSANFAAGIVGSVQRYDKTGENKNMGTGLDVTISDNITTTEITQGKNGKCVDAVVYNNAITLADGGTYVNTNNIAGKVRIGNTGYWTLGSAVTDAKSGDTITLLTDVTTDSPLEISKNITLDLNGKTITGNGCRAFWVKSGGSLNVTGKGTITSENVDDCTKSVIRVGETGTASFTMGKDVTINAPSTYGVTIFGTGIQIAEIYGTVNCTYSDSGASAVSGEGSPKNNAESVTTTITIGSTAKITTTNDVAVYKPNTGTLTVENGAQIEGAGGIEVKAGEVVINGNPTIKAKAEESHTFSSSGTSTKGYAISVLNISNGVGYKGKAKVTVNGGIFTGGIAILDDKKDDGTAMDTSKNGTISITGGTFTTSPKAYVAGGYSVYKYSDSDYVVANANPSGYYWTAANTDAQKAEYDFVGTKISYSGGGTSSTTTTTTDSVTNKTEDRKTDTSADTGATTVATTTATVKTETKTQADGTKTVAATVDNTTASKIVEKAVENKSEEVIVNTATSETVTETAAGTKTEVAIPVTTVSEIAEKTEAAVTIKTDAAEVKLDKEAVKAVAEQTGITGDVKLVVETVAQNAEKVQVELKLETASGKVSDFKGGSVSVTVKLSTALAAKPVVCVYIDDNGTYHKVEGVKNADGTFTFKTGHFSSYAVMTEEEADKVIAEQTANVENLAKALTLKARSAKTAKGNIKVTLTVDEDTIKAIEELGYTVKYKFYRSTKKASSYKVAIEKAEKTYTNTTGKKGTKYYYKARVMVYSAQGELIAKTELKQCRYAARTR